MDGLLFRRHAWRGPIVNVKTILHRNNPILTCAPQHKPVDETGLAQGHRRRGANLARAGRLRHSRSARRLEPRGRPRDALHRDPDQAALSRPRAQALHVACSCQGGAYAGKWTVVVDEDIDAGDLDQVLWAMCTRFDPMTDIDTGAEGLGVEARSAVSARQFQQPHPDRRLHSLRHEAEGHLPAGGRCQRRTCASKLKAKFPQLFRSA